jgi:hypothetical protein
MKPVMLTRVPWITILVFVLIGGAAAAGALDQDYEWSEPMPPVTSDASLTAAVEDPALGLSLDPPGESATPVIDGREAAGIVWAEEGAPGQPKEIHVTYALLTWGSDFRRSPVWVVTYLGGECIPAAGGPGDPYTCVDEPFHTLVDADTGEYIASVVSPGIGDAGL